MPPRLPAPNAAPRTGAPPVIERLLESLGADPSFAESILGDLAEEYAVRAAGNGVIVARWWYAYEALRSAPHLVRSALRCLGPRGVARLAASLAGVVLASVLALLALSARKGPPERLVASTVVVNGHRPVRLPMRVLDAAGRVLPDTGVRYALAVSPTMSVSPAGEVTCARPGDAIVRASLGPLATHVHVRCRPVVDLLGPGMLDLIVGAPAQDIPFEALGSDGRAVTLLVGRIKVGDSAIATLEGPRIRAHAEGVTSVQVLVGDQDAFSSVHAYTPTDSPEAVRPDQHLAVPVRLTLGETREWRLPAGLYFLRALPDHGNQPRPRLAVVGASCTPFGVTHLECFARADMSVLVRYPRRTDAAPEMSGTLLVWRLPDP